jgi:hypothetical protein
MCRKIFTTFVLIFSLMATVISQMPAPQKITPGKWITSWLLCGPIPLNVHKDPSLSSDHLDGFNTDYLIKSGGEQNLLVSEGDIVRLKKDQ